MLEELFKIVDTYRTKVTDYVDISVIEEKQRELNAKFPEPMVEFYRHFGNDKKILSSFYIFDKVEDIQIENEALTFGEKYREIGRLGIPIDEIDTDIRSVLWYSYDYKEWYAEEGMDVIFFFGMACWQVLMTMPSVAKVHLSKKKFENLIGNNLKYLSDEKLLRLGEVVPVIDNDILGCYRPLDETLYLGSIVGAEVLEKYNELLKLDWL